MTYRITHVPQKKFIGMKIKTTMDKGQQECSALWVFFGPRVEKELAPTGYIIPNNESYGISSMISETEFYYWAAVELKEDATAPELPLDMEIFELKVHDYVVRTSHGLNEISQTYSALYMEWPSSQSEYDLDFMSPCFEHYKGDFTPASSFDIYVPIKKK